MSDLDTIKNEARKDDYRPPREGPSVVAQLLVVLCILVAVGLGGGYLFLEVEKAERARRDTTQWNVAKQLNTASAFEEYLKNHPDGRFAEEAVRAVVRFRDAVRSADQVRKNAEETRRNAEEAKRRADEAAERAAWRDAQSKATRESVEGYLEKYPNGLFVADARKSLTQFEPVFPLTREAEKGLTAGKEFRECLGCPVLTVVPPGEFTMGVEESEVREGNAYTSQVPAHTVKHARSFAIGKYEVSFSEWEVCVSEGGCRGYRPGDEGWGRAKLPVINVSWDDAKLYVKWLSNKTGKVYRLPTEAEWEYAARAGSTTRFHFGDDAKSLCRYANVADESGSKNRRGSAGFSSWLLCNDGHFRTAPVGSFAPNDFNLHDMLGNVIELVEDVWHGSYQGAPTDGSAWTVAGEPNVRVGRGGSHNHLQAGVTSAVRFKLSTSAQGNTIGLRVARSIDP